MKYDFYLMLILIFWIIKKKLINMKTKIKYQNKNIMSLHFNGLGCFYVMVKYILTINDNKFYLVF